MKIAVIAAHPDDAEVWCGGTIRKHAQRGDHVAIFGFFQQKPHRVQCAQKSANYLGASYASHKPKINSLDNTYTRELEKFRPDIVLTHWEDDSHPDHVATREIAVSSIIHLVRAGVIPKAVFSFATYHNRGGNHFFNPNFYVDVTKEWNDKIEAIRIHDSESPEEIIEEIEPLFRLNGKIVNCNYAEGFKEIPIFGRFGSKLRKPEFLE